MAVKKRISNNINDLPDSLSAPALRAMLNARITTLSQLSNYSEREILKLHGVGPSSIPVLKKALRTKNLQFKKEL